MLGGFPHFMWLFRCARLPRILVRLPRILVRLRSPDHAFFIKMPRFYALFFGVGTSHRNREKSIVEFPDFNSRPLRHGAFKIDEIQGGAVEKCHIRNGGQCAWQSQGIIALERRIVDKFLHVSGVKNAANVHKGIIGCAY